MIGIAKRRNRNPLDQPGNKPNLRPNGRGAMKNGRPVREAAVDTNHMQAAQKSSVAKKSLSSRKIVWLEKIKLHLSIFVCNARVKLGMYSNTFDRQALKESIKESERMLKTLKEDADLKANEERFQEAVEDSENLAAVAAGVKIAGYYLKKVPRFFWD